MIVGAEHSNTDEMLSPDVKKKTENHEYSIQGKSLQTGNNKKYVRKLLLDSFVHAFNHTLQLANVLHSWMRIQQTRH